LGVELTHVLLQLKIEWSQFDNIPPCAGKQQQIDHDATAFRLRVRTGSLAWLAAAMPAVSGAR